MAREVYGAPPTSSGYEPLEQVIAEEMVEGGCGGGGSEGGSGVGAGEGGVGEGGVGEGGGKGEDDAVARSTGSHCDGQAMTLSAESRPSAQTAEWLGWTIAYV